jgi:PAS domain S-box-containing protein
VTESDFQAFELVGALVVVLDPDGRIVHWNRRCSNLTAYSLEEVRGRRLWEFALVPEDVEPFKAIFATLLTSERASPYANSWVTRAGERRWIAWSHTLTTHPDGRVQYVIKTGIDRTESQEVLEALRSSGARFDTRLAEVGRLYQEAREAADDLREVNQHMVDATIRAQELAELMEAALKISENRERDLQTVAEFREMFLGIVGHDLRNPLGTIVMTAEVLRHSGHLDAREQRDVSRIVASCGRMSRMILQLLDFTRARLGGGFPIQPKPTSLRDVCRNVVDEFGAAVHLEVNGEVTGTWDPDRLAEALSNVTGNAVEHARPGTTALVRTRTGDSEAVVEIVNQGDPIPPDVLPFIFEPFRQATRERSTKGNLGLGLYIARQIVVASGGTLEVRSADGTTTFVMRLPRNGRALIPTSSRAEAHA